MKYLKYIVLLIIVCLIIGLGGFLLQRLRGNTPDTTAVVQEMRALNRWETASFTVEKVIDQGSSGNVFQQFLFGNRILLIAHGEVIAGFDLANFSSNNVLINGSSINLTLPAPQILITSLDESKTRVYDREKGILVPSNNNLESDARASAQNSIQSAACSEGILTNASDNAKKELTPILNSLGFQQITITIPQGKC